MHLVALLLGLTLTGISVGFSPKLYLHTNFQRFTHFTPTLKPSKSHTTLNMSTSNGSTEDPYMRGRYYYASARYPNQEIPLHFIHVTHVIHLPTDSLCYTSSFMPNLATYYTHPSSYRALITAKSHCALRMLAPVPFNRPYFACCYYYFSICMGELIRELPKAHIEAAAFFRASPSAWHYCRS